MALVGGVTVTEGGVIGGMLGGVAAIIGSAGKGDGGAGVETTNPYNLTKTHNQTLSKSEMKKLVKDIETNGIKEPIKYVEYNGNKYVVDGHHRLLAAKQLGLKEIPVQQVNLPYGGYKTIEDLLWVN